MHDLLPPESEEWLEVVDRFRRQFGRAGYGYIQTPILEDLAVFTRVGEGTDVVTKEMYDFVDKDGTTIALRPESTAGVARSFIQHRPLVPWKVWYTSQHFRHENTQAGRYRQHHQLGAECFGSDHPDIDVELIVGLWDFYRDLGLENIRLQINSLGERETRVRYQELLRTYLESRLDELHPTDREKVQRNPMRVLDTKFSESLPVVYEAPRLVDHLTDDDRDRFERVHWGVMEARIPTDRLVMEPRLVRGLDYYTHTVFEIVSDALDSAQSTIGGGGRYDGLVEALGGPPAPGVGFGSGIERILLALRAEDVAPLAVFALDAFVVTFGDNHPDPRELMLGLRREGIGVDRALNQHNPRKQMDRAKRVNPRFVIRLGKDADRPSVVEVADQRDESSWEIDLGPIVPEQAGKLAEAIKART
jgi:histidyl-tRNA synthetase